MIPGGGAAASTGQPSAARGGVAAAAERQVRAVAMPAGSPCLVTSEAIARAAALSSQGRRPAASSGTPLLGAGMKGVS